jgi:hypothetical protein
LFIPRKELSEMEKSMERTISRTRITKIQGEGLVGLESM